MKIPLGERIAILLNLHFAESALHPIWPEPSPSNVQPGPDMASPAEAEFSAAKRGVFLENFQISLEATATLGFFFTHPLLCGFAAPHRIRWSTVISSIFQKGIVGHGFHGLSENCSETLFGEGKKVKQMVALYNVYIIVNINPYRYIYIWVTDKIIVILI